MQMFVRKKNGLIVLFIVLIASIVFFMFEKNNTSTANLAIITSTPTSSNTFEAPTQLLSSTTSSVTNSAETSAAIKQAANKRAQDVLIIQNWAERKGYGKPANNDSDNYNLETLRQLALNGDESLIRKVAQLYLHENDLVGAEKFYQEAAVRGSIRALSGLASMLDSWIYTQEVDLTKKKEVAMEILALNEVEGIRGERTATSVFKIANVTKFKQDNIQFNDSDRAFIKERAQTIYDELQKKRNDLGLGLFDNSVPEAVTKYMDEVDKIYKDRKISDVLHENTAP